MVLDFFYWFFQSIEWKFTFKIVLCLLMGFLIGKERAAKGKNAWVSTFSLVITGAMLFTELSEMVDPASTSRIAAQIVTGIWFLGAWLIMHDGWNVRNLTTAAGIRFAWAIGMAVGFWFYGIAVIATVVAAMVPRTSDTLFTRKKYVDPRKEKDDTDESDDE